MQVRRYRVQGFQSRVVARATLLLMHSAERLQQRLDTKCGQQRQDECMLLAGAVPLYVLAVHFSYHSYCHSASALPGDAAAAVACGAALCCLAVAAHR